MRTLILSAGLLVALCSWGPRRPSHRMNTLSVIRAKRVP